MKPLAIVLLCAVPAAAADLLPLPAGWDMIGIGRASYEAGVDPGVLRDGRPAGTLLSRGDDASLPGVLAQVLSAEAYRGKRLRYRCFLKYEGVRRQVGPWMWALDAKGSVLTSDFMDDRKLRGDSGWRQEDIVLDVPRQAVRIVYGLRLWGAGRAWISGMRLDAVGREVPPTNRPARLPLEPVNLF